MTTQAQNIRYARALNRAQLRLNSALGKGVPLGDPKTPMTEDLALHKLGVRKHDSTTGLTGVLEYVSLHNNRLAKARQIWPAVPKEAKPAKEAKPETFDTPEGQKVLPLRVTREEKKPKSKPEGKNPDGKKAKKRAPNV